MMTHKQAYISQGENSTNPAVQWSMHGFPVDSLCQVPADPQSIHLLEKIWFHSFASFNIKHDVELVSNYEIQKKGRETLQD